MDEGGVRRDRGRPAIVGLAALVLLVGVGALVAVALGRGGTDALAVDPGGSAAAASGPACAPNPALVQAPPPIPDRARQQAVVDRVASAAYPDFAVRVAEPTALGVYALVTGNLDEARSVLTAAGVTRVEPWDPGLAAASADGHVQIQMAIQTLLDPVIARVREQIPGVPGDGGMAVWQDAGAVLLSWKAPVPDAVAALAGRDWGNGVRVIVRAVPYSLAELLRAQRRLDDPALRTYDVTTTSPCGDDSGLEIGIDPQHWPADPAAIRERLTDLAGVPVALAKESAGVALGRASAGGSSG